MATANNWTGAVSNLWNTSGNWSLNRVPNSNIASEGDKAIYNATTAVRPLTTVQPNTSAQWLFIVDGGGVPLNWGNLSILSTRTFDEVENRYDGYLSIGNNVPALTLGKMNGQVQGTVGTTENPGTLTIPTFGTEYIPNQGGNTLCLLDAVCRLVTQNLGTLISGNTAIGPAVRSVTVTGNAENDISIGDDGSSFTTTRPPGMVVDFTIPAGNENESHFYIFGGSVVDFKGAQFSVHARIDGDDTGTARNYTIDVSNEQLVTQLPGFVTFDMNNPVRVEVGQTLRCNYTGVGRAGLVITEVTSVASGITLENLTCNRTLHEFSGTVPAAWLNGDGTPVQLKLYDRANNVTIVIGQIAAPLSYSLEQTATAFGQVLNGTYRGFKPLNLSIGSILLNVTTNNGVWESDVISADSGDPESPYEPGTYGVTITDQGSNEFENFATVVLAEAAKYSLTVDRTAAQVGETLELKLTDLGTAGSYPYDYNVSSLNGLLDVKKAAGQFTAAGTTVTLKAKVKSFGRERVKFRQDTQAVFPYQSPVLTLQPKTRVLHWQFSLPQQDIRGQVKVYRVLTNNGLLIAETSKASVTVAGSNFVIEALDANGVKIAEGRMVLKASHPDVELDDTADTNPAGTPPAMAAVNSGPIQSVDRQTVQVKLHPFPGSTIVSAALSLVNQLAE